LEQSIPTAIGLEETYLFGPPQPIAALDETILVAKEHRTG